MRLVRWTLLWLAVLLASFSAAQQAQALLSPRITIWNFAVDPDTDSLYVYIKWNWSSSTTYFQYRDTSFGDFHYFTPYPGSTSCVLTLLSGDWASGDTVEVYGYKNGVQQAYTQATIP